MGEDDEPENFRYENGSPLCIATSKSSPCHKIHSGAFQGAEDYLWEWTCGCNEFDFAYPKLWGCYSNPGSDGDRGKTVTAVFKTVHPYKNPTINKDRPSQWPETKILIFKAEKTQLQRKVSLSRSKLLHFLARISKNFPSI